MSIVQQTFWNSSELESFKGDKTRVPLRAARHFGFPLQHHEVDGVAWYALQDWVRGITGETSAKKVSQIINVMRKESDVDLKSNSQKFPYKANDGKTYKRDYVTNDDLYRVVAYLRQTTDRPVLKQLKEYLVKAGVWAEEAMADPETAAARLQGMVSRKAFMAALVQAIDSMPRWFPGIATNDIYEGLFERTYKGLCEALRTDSPRDKMGKLALRYLDIAEEICAHHIGQAEHLSTDTARGIIQDVATIIGSQVRETERIMGTDIVTGRRVLGAIDAIKGA